MRVKLQKKTLLRLLIAFTSLNILFLSLLFIKQQTTLTIHITNDGFSPQEIAISQYTTITFINQDNIEHWPASNIHPTHDLYPEFDPTRALKSNEKWSFTPQKEGTWEFHDHLYPHKRGTLQVTKASRLTTLWHKLTEKTSEEVRPTSQRQPLRQDTKAYAQVTTYAKENGVEAAWQYINTTYAKDNGTTGSIHDLAHLTGKLIYEEKGMAGLSICTPTFAFGCYHGFLDAAFKKDLSNLLEAEKACQTVGKVGSGPYGGCTHGIGHGVASYYQTQDIKKALATCEKLPDSAKSSCYDGVFMEFERGVSSDFYKKTDPLYPCNSLNEKYIYACGRNQPNVMLNHFRMSYKEVAETCAKTTIQDLKTSCFVALGFIATYRSGGDAKNIIESCQTIPDPSFRLQCTSASAGELIFQNISGWQQKAPQVCNSLRDDDLNACQEYIAKIQKDYGR